MNDPRQLKVTIDTGDKPLLLSTFVRVLGAVNDLFEEVQKSLSPDGKAPIKLMVQNMDYTAPDAEEETHDADA